MRFSKEEIIQLLRAWILVALAFSIAIVGPKYGYGALLSRVFFDNFLIALLTVGLGFVLHELAHKYFGQKFGKHSEFRAFDKYLLLALILSFVGFLFLLPGAVYTRGAISKRQLGIICLAGPVMNFIVGSAFFAMMMYVPQGFWFNLAVMGTHINFYLFMFNMLPFWIIDGAKVWRWNKYVFIPVFLLSIAAAFGYPYLAKFLGIF